MTEKEHHEKETPIAYIAIMVAIIFVLGLVIFSQYKISATNTVLDKVALSLASVKKGGGEVATSGPAGMSPQMGISYDTNGYNALLSHYKTIKLSADDSKKVAGIDVELPCCGFKNIATSKDGTADFDGSCHCGHHDAMYGLAKFMIQKGYRREDIQKEENIWKEVFFPTAGGGNLGGCA